MTTAQTMTTMPLHVEATSYGVRTRGLVKRYGRVVALDGVDLEVPEGAFQVLVGPNGAGKSTLMRVLLNVVRADAGEVRVMDVDVRRAGDSARAQIGFVPEQHALPHSSLTIARLLEHHATFYPTWDEGYARRIADALEIRPDRKCGALSKGQSRRVQLLMALAHRPPLLLLDEPSDGLDHVARDAMLSLLTDHLSDAPTTVLLSTHRVHEFERLVDHMAVLRDGRLRVQTSRDRLDAELRRYRADVPEGWQATALDGTTLGPVRRAGFGREIEFVAWGERARVGAAAERAGARIADASRLTLDEAATAFLSARETA